MSDLCVFNPDGAHRRGTGRDRRECADCDTLLTENLPAAEADRDALADMVIAALKIHRKTVGWTRPIGEQRVDYSGCTACGSMIGWPCPTATALGVTA